MSESFFSSPLGIVGVVIAAAFLIYEIIRRRYYVFSDGVKLYVGIPFINRPPRDRIGDAHIFERELTWKYNTTVIRYVNPLKPWSRGVLVGDPELLRQIYVGAQWDLFQRPHEFQESQKGHAGGLILMPNDSKWRDAREALGNRTFSSTTLRTYVPILREQFKIFLDKVEADRKAGAGAVDLQDFYNNLTFDTITRLVFGESAKAQTSTEGQAYLKAWDGVLGLSSILSLLQTLAGTWIWTLFPKIFKTHRTALGKIYSLIDSNVARRRRGEDLDRVSILDDMYRNEKVPAWLKEDDAVRQQLTTLLFAGHDTTAALLSFLTYELATHPEWQQRIRQEVLDAFGKPSSNDSNNDLITNLDKLEGLPVLNASIKECLRLYPSAPSGAGRGIKQDFTVHYNDVITGKPKTLELYKGDFLRPSMYIAQTFPAYWNAEFGSVLDFNPDRFLKDTNGGAASMWAFAPFGHGGRRCAGERLALAEARLCISELVRRYEFAMQPGFKVKVLNTGTIKARDGVKVVLKPLV